MQLKLLNIFKNLCRFKHCFVNRQLMKINGKLWHICYTNRSKYISEYTVLATIKLYSYIYDNKKYISVMRAKCVQTCLHPSMSLFPLLQVKPQRHCWKLKSYFYWRWFFFNSFIFELLTLLLEYSFLYHVYTSHMQWWSIEYNAGFFVNKVICFSKSITVTDLIHMLCYLCELLYNPLSSSIEYICIIVLW